MLFLPSNKKQNCRNSNLPKLLVFVSKTQLTRVKNEFLTVMSLTLTTATYYGAKAVPRLSTGAE